MTHTAHTSQIAALKHRLKAWEAEAKTNSQLSDLAPKVCRAIRAEIAELEAA